MQENNPILPWNKCRYLTLTSCLFFTSAIYSYSCRLYFLAFVAGLTSIVSANFWRNPVPGIRRDIDLVYSKLSFLIFFCNGVTYVRSVPYMLIFYPGLGCMIWSFYTSNATYYMKKEDWWKYHLIFHGTVLATQFAIIQSKAAQIME
jgi:hypothetical protein